VRQAPIALRSTTERQATRGFRFAEKSFIMA